MLVEAVDGDQTLAQKSHFSFKPLDAWPTDVYR